MDNSNWSDMVEKKEKIYDRLWFRILVIIGVLAIAFSVRQFLEKKYLEISNVGTGTVTYYDGEGRVGRDLLYAENVSEDNPILQAFKEAFPNVKVLLACEEDLTNDGCKDLVVIYNTTEKDEHTAYSTLVDGGYIRLVVAIDSGDGENYSFTDPIPAPIENQKIQFQNIDKTDEIEFVLQGQKGSKVGYGIYRVMNGAPVNLFGEGLEEC